MTTQGVESHILKYLTVREPVWMRHDFVRGSRPTEDRVNRFAEEARQWISMVKWFDRPKDALQAAMDAYQETPTSETVQTIASRFGVTPQAVLSIANFGATPTAWKCPVCSVSKLELFALDRGTIKTVRLERHHDHIEDFYGVFRFRRTVLCADCNNYDARLKRGLENDPTLDKIDWSLAVDPKIKARLGSLGTSRVAPFYSFSPSEMKDIITLRTTRTQPNAEELSVAKSIYQKAMDGGLEGLISKCRRYVDQVGDNSSVHDEDGLTLHHELNVSDSALSFFIRDIASPPDSPILGPGASVFIYLPLGKRLDIAPRSLRGEEIVYDTEDYGLRIVPFSPSVQTFSTKKVEHFLTGAVGEIHHFTPFEDSEYGYQRFSRWWDVFKVLDVSDDELSALFGKAMDGPWSKMSRRIRAENGGDTQIDFSRQYIEVGEDWRCPICSRNKFEMITFTNSKRRLVKCVAYYSSDFEGVGHFAMTTICLECQTFAHKLNKEARQILSHDHAAVKTFCDLHYGNPEQAAVDFADKFRLPTIVLYFLKQSIQKYGYQKSTSAGLKWWMENARGANFAVHGQVPEFDYRTTFQAICDDLGIDQSVARDALSSLSFNTTEWDMQLLPGQIAVAPLFWRAPTSSFDPLVHAEKVSEWIAKTVNRALDASSNLVDFARCVAESGIRIRVKKGTQLRMEFRFCHSSTTINFSRSSAPADIEKRMLPAPIYDHILRQVASVGHAVELSEIAF